MPAVRTTHYLLQSLTPAIEVQSNPSNGVVCCEPLWTWFDDLESPSGNEVVHKGWVVQGGFVVDFNGEDIASFEHDGNTYDVLRLSGKNEIFRESLLIGDLSDLGGFMLAIRDEDLVNAENPITLRAGLSWNDTTSVMTFYLFVNGDDPDTERVVEWDFDFSGVGDEYDPSPILSTVVTDGSMRASFSARKMSALDPHNSSGSVTSASAQDVYSGAVVCDTKLLDGQWINAGTRTISVRDASDEIYPTPDDADYYLDHAPYHSTDKIEVDLVQEDGSGNVIWEARYAKASARSDWTPDEDGYVSGTKDLDFVEYTYRNPAWWEAINPGEWHPSTPREAPTTLEFEITQDDPDDEPIVYGNTAIGFYAGNPVVWRAQTNVPEYSGEITADDGSKWEARYNLFSGSKKGFSSIGGKEWSEDASRFYHLIGWLILRDKAGAGPDYRVYILPIYLTTALTSTTASASISAYFLYEEYYETTITLFQGSVSDPDFDSPIVISNNITAVGGDGMVEDEYGAYGALDLAQNGTVTLTVGE